MGGLALLGLLLAGLTGLGVWLALPPGRAAAPAPSEPSLAPLAPLELPALDLEALSAPAPVVTAAPQLAWIFPPLRTPTWSEVELAAPPADLASRSAAGRALASKLCADCHGPEGRGDGPLAASLRGAPRDLTGPLATRTGRGAAQPEEVFRSVSAGAPLHGMPSFAQLSPDQRWDLTAYVLSLQPSSVSFQALALPPAPEVPDLRLGQAVYRAQCAACHGSAGGGDGPLAGALRARSGRPAPPPDLRAGPAHLRGGAGLADLARTISLGRPGTFMEAVELSPAELWGVAAYVRRLSEVGLARRRQAWNEFFRAWQPLAGVEGAAAGAPLERWNERLSARWADAPAGRETGCLACHEGLSEIASGDMQRALEATGGGVPSGACVVCHEGRADARQKLEAHAGLIGNPGSLWATSFGLGCAKCHSQPGALKTLQGRSLPEPVGGALMHVRSRRTDPSGASSGNYTYRVQRSLMAQETGKVLLLTSSADLADPAHPQYSDYPTLDTDSAVPAVGSEAYKRLVASGLASGYLQRLPQTSGVPTFSEALALCGGEETEGALPRAGLIDYGRKNCFRCHVWGEGKSVRLEHRSSGCSACHVEWGDEGLYEGRDRTVPKRRPGHPRAHRLVMTPRDEQCNHCHTRNPYTLHSEPHQRAGMGCVDCHTSIDLHGDGNVYPSMEHQVEIRCQDCHGTAAQRPWELPLGHGTPLAEGGERGVREVEGESARFLLTNRGNPRRNWVREGDEVLVDSYLSGRRHRAPLLGQAAPALQPAQSGCSESIAGHESVSCSLCHNRQAPRCGSCHMTYDRSHSAQDWLLSPLAYQPGSLRQREVFTPGQVSFEAERKGSVPFGAPDTRRDRANRWAPREPGCQVELRYVERGRTRGRFVPRFNPGGASYPPIVANSLPHENAIPARTCAECHPEGTGPGKPLRLFGDVQPDRGDWWRAPQGGAEPPQRAPTRWRR